MAIATLVAATRAAIRAVTLPNGVASTRDLGLASAEAKYARILPTITSSKRDDPVVRRRSLERLGGCHCSISLLSRLFVTFYIRT